VFHNETIITGALKENVTNEIMQTDCTTLERSTDKGRRRLARTAVTSSTEYNVNWFNMKQGTSLTLHLVHLFLLYESPYIIFKGEIILIFNFEGSPPSFTDSCLMMTLKV
jgi:hypothetical protein